MQASIIIIGGGESCKSLLPTFPDYGIAVMSINSHGLNMPYNPSIAVWLDEKFFWDHRSELLKIDADGTVLCTQELDVYKGCPQVITFPINKKSDRFGYGNLFVGSYNLSGFFALSLACHLGYEKIYLLGYDFKSAGPDRLTYEDGQGNIWAWVNEFDYYKRNYPDVKIYNVCPDSKIKSFPKIDFSEFERMVKYNG